MADMKDAEAVSTVVDESVIMRFKRVTASRRRSSVVVLQLHQQHQHITNIKAYRCSVHVELGEGVGEPDMHA